jgi:hypothetical protein
MIMSTRLCVISCAIAATSIGVLDPPPPRSHFVRKVEEDGQLHTLGLLEQLRDQCKSLWGTSSELYFRLDKLLNQLANPNLHDIPSNLQIRVELWNRYDKHIRWVIADTSSIVIGNAAYDVAVSVHPRERVLLRQGIRVIRVPRTT